MNSGGERFNGHGSSSSSSIFDVECSQSEIQHDGFTSSNDGHHRNVQSSARNHTYAYRRPLGLNFHFLNSNSQRTNQNGVQETSHWMGIGFRMLSRSRSQFQAKVKSKSKPKWRKVLLPLIILVGTHYYFPHHSQQLYTSVHRILCHDKDPDHITSPYVTENIARMSPRSMARRNPPSHIILCQELIQRHQVAEKGFTFDDFGIEEDEELCRDYTSPHLDLMEIFSSTLVAHAGKEYNMKYKHNCADSKSGRDRDRDPDYGAVDGKEGGSDIDADWTTIQQEFPKSSLVLDNGSVDRDHIVKLCKGCLFSFQSTTLQRSNAALSHMTHHCLLFPGSPEPLVDKNGEVDTVAVSEALALVHDIPLARIIPTVSDRLRAAANNYRIENSDDYGGLSQADEDSNGAVIFIDDTSLVMGLLPYANHIPKSVGSIQIITSALCAAEKLPTGEGCINHGQNLRVLLDNAYNPNPDQPSVDVRHDVVTSTAAAYSRMIFSKYLVCPPGTTSCLFPALAKEEGTYAIITESKSRSGTFHWFDITGRDKVNIQVSEVSESGESLSNILAGTGTTVPAVATETGDLAAFDQGESKTGYREGCSEMRGRLGSWEQDFSYLDLLNSTSKNNVFGDTRKGVIAQRYSPVSESFTDKHGGQGYNRAQSAPKESASKSDDPAWKTMPDCDLDLLNLEGLCDVIDSMKLHVLQFIGDEYTEEMVKSFWSLLGLPDADFSGKENLSDGPPYVFRKTVHCPIKKIAFDIVFTPNEKLINTHRPEEKPEPKAIPKPKKREGSDGNWRGNDGGHEWLSTNVGTKKNLGDVRTGNGNGNGVGVLPRSGNVGNYGDGGFARSGNVGNYGGGGFARSGNGGNYGGGGNNCNCQPWVPQYQAGGGRQAIIAGMNPNMSYDEWCQQQNQFGRGVMDYVQPNDVVMMRTGMQPHGSCGCQQCGGGYRKLRGEGDAMDSIDIEKANNFLIKTVDEYRRLTGQSDPVSPKPWASNFPKIQVLDVTEMTMKHPHAKASSTENDHGRKLCQQSMRQTAPMYDSWNHVLYSNLRDVAAAERNQQRQPVQQQPVQMYTPQQRMSMGIPYFN